MFDANKFWGDLIFLNRHVDSLIERVKKARKQSDPISREIPAYLSEEVVFQNLPPRFSSTVNPASDIITGNNMKLAVFENGGSRLYIREMSLTPWLAGRVNTLAPTGLVERVLSSGALPFNFRWNWWTSITNRRYAQRPVMADSAGRHMSGSHLTFREPLVLEPREALNVEITLMSFGMASFQATTLTQAIVQCSLSGYREGM